MAGTTDIKRSSVGEPAGSRLTLRHLGLLLVVAGLLITGYMTYNKLAGVPLECAETGLMSCSKVESSAWSTVLGVPTALLGFITHLVIGAIILLEPRSTFFKEYGVLMLVGITLFGVLYHAYLTFYVSMIALKAFCPYCLTAAAVMLLQFIVSGVRLRRYLAS